MTAHDIAIYKPCAVIEGVNELADEGCIAPPGQAMAFALIRAKELPFIATA